jgi:sugar phosphate isomerase/epimerase
LKIGFVNACLTQLSFEEQLAWAHSHGFGALELHGRPQAAKVDFQKVATDKGEAARVKELLAKYQIEISGIMFGGHNLHPDKERRMASQNHLKNMIAAAAALDIAVVSTFIGRDHNLPVKENYKLVEREWPELMKFAEEHGRKIAIENCPMMDEWPSGYNIAFSPEVWEVMFNLLPSPNLGLNFDPSHLHWLGMDYIAALKKYGAKVLHTQAKDVEILQDRLNQVGILGEGWWRYRLPGLGAVDWGKFISTLQELGYDGAISIEHEDPVWEGSVEKVQRGLIFSQRYLSQFLI